MRLDAFDFELPQERIAQQPAEPRDASRLLVLRVREGAWEHRVFRDLPGLLEPGDLLVRNVSRVVPARLRGHREATGGRWEGLFLAELPDGTWEILATTRGRPRPGERVVVGPAQRLVLLEPGEGGRWLVRPEPPAPALEILDQVGEVPLPPYIHKGRARADDRTRYQTVYAREPGSVAAPTAGLHVTPAVLDGLAARGIETLDITLHVGVGTFRPIEVERIEEHRMHAEWAELTAAAAARLNEQRTRGGRIVAVGTTSTRVLEAAAGSGRFQPLRGPVDLFIRPGHPFQGVDALITNFHLPRSSLLVLVSALGGIELIRAAYAEAIRLEYRFYSYGDAMLILP